MSSSPDKHGKLRQMRKKAAKATGMHGVFSKKRHGTHTVVSSPGEPSAQGSSRMGASPVESDSSLRAESASLAARAEDAFGSRDGTTSQDARNPMSKVPLDAPAEALEAKEAAAQETADVAAQRIEERGAARLMRPSAEGSDTAPGASPLTETLSVPEVTMSPLLGASGRHEELAAKAAGATPSLIVGSGSVGGARTADLSDIRVTPQKSGGCLGGKGAASFAVMVPSSLCATLTRAQIPGEYVSVVHSYKEFAALDAFLAATVPSDDVPPLPTAGSGTCLVCGGSGSQSELAQELRDYLEDLFRIPSSQLSSARGPLASFFGVSEDL